MRRLVLNAWPNQMIERGGVGDTRSEVLQVPEISKSLENRGSGVRLSLAVSWVGAVILSPRGEGVRGDQESGHTATQTVEVKGVVLSVGGSFGISLVVRVDSSRGRDVVEETTCLIVSQQKERFFPLGTVAESLIDLLNKNLTVGDIASRVHGVGVDTAARRVEVGQLRKLAKISILEEILDRDDAGIGVGGSPFEEKTVGKKFAIGAVVVEPRDVLAGSFLEDAVDVNTRGKEGVIIITMAIRGTSNGTKTVGVGWLFKLLTFSLRNN